MGMLASAASTLTLVARPVHPHHTLLHLTLLLQQIRKMMKMKVKKKMMKMMSEAYRRPPEQIFGA
jgi:hypothetical protein